MFPGGCWVAFLLGNSSFSPAQVRSLTTHAVIFEGLGFVTEKSGDVSFYCLAQPGEAGSGEKYFRRTSQAQFQTCES